MILTLKNLSKSYGNNKALQGFTANLHSGVHALLGPNGSGKSTLINIITDNLKADSGEITYISDTGQEENIFDMGTRFREKLGFMPQYPGLYPDFTVEELLRYMAILKDLGADMKKKERKIFIQEQITDVLKAVELDGVIHYKVKTLSGGMKQRLALAQAVLGNPEILILDEPTAGLDPKQRITIRNYISQIALNKIVIIATHVVSDVEFIARNIILLKKGSIVDMAHPHELIAKMNGKVWLVDCKEQDVPDLQARYAIINLAPSEDQAYPVRVRMLADSVPVVNSVAATPVLEDYYLYLFGREYSGKI